MKDATTAHTRELLAVAPLTPLGYLANASNATLLCRVGDEADQTAAVYKPAAGERPLWDFPAGSLCRREVAAYLVSEALGWGVVPPTVLRDGPAGEGSAQLFVAHDPRLHYFVLIDDEGHHAALARLAAFDLLINNADRKGSHVLLGEGDARLYGIDHGVTFHPQPKLRTVIWELGGRPLERSWRADMARLGDILHSPDDPLVRRLCSLLSGREIAATAARAQALAATAALPVLDEERRPYPWPPL